MWSSFVKQIAKTILIAIASISLFLTSSPAANAYPFWAQETAPATPREATGRTCSVLTVTLVLNLPK